MSYSHSALPVSSEAVSLFRFLLRTEDWKALVEQTLLRPLVDMTERILTFQVSAYIIYISTYQQLISSSISPFPNFSFFLLIFIYLIFLYYTERWHTTVLNINRRSGTLSGLHRIIKCTWWSC